MREHINEYVGSAVSNGKLPELFDEHRNGRMSCDMSKYQKMCLDSRKCGGLARCFNNSCDHNGYTTKWRVQGCDHLGVFAEHGIKLGEELSLYYQWYVNYSRIPAKYHRVSHICCFF